MKNQNLLATARDRKDKDWRTLRKLDAEVAERLMGWTRYSEVVHRTDNRTIEGVLYCPPDYPEVSRGGLNCVPYYSSDIAAAMKVEDRIAELNLKKEYVTALAIIAAKAATEAGEIFGYWHIAHATAEQRCRAALSLVEAPKETQS